MKLHELSPAAGSTKARKRIGRGAGSGQGKTAGKGHKGQKARAGRGMRPGFEGGQMPLQRRLPKRGFNNIFRIEMAIVNVAALDKAFEAGETVTVDALVSKGLVKKVLGGVKVLGNGAWNLAYAENRCALCLPGALVFSAFEAGRDRRSGGTGGSAAAARRRDLPEPVADYHCVGRKPYGLLCEKEDWVPGAGNRGGALLHRPAGGRAGRPRRYGLDR